MSEESALHRLSIVIPVYRGERTLRPLVEELASFIQEQHVDGMSWLVAEVVAVWDGATNDSARVMQELAEQYPFFRSVWLSRNYGQHPATLAGMASTSASWVVTMDEDGMHDPADLASLLRMAVTADMDLVYAQPRNKPAHGWFRNTASAIVKWLLRSVLGNAAVGRFTSFRLIRGDIARSLAAYCGHGVFLDVALSWVVGSVGHCPVDYRRREERSSGYSLRSLMSHFWRLLITSGTRPLRAITLLGALAILVAILLAAYAVWIKIEQGVSVQGWTSIVVAMAFFPGCILFALGLIAEYLAVAVGIVMGKPLYLTVARPRRFHKAG
jgi:undecaprenyl-phosphate 4-deoxy-4-formamido-L-arabinose transferase